MLGNGFTFLKVCSRCSSCSWCTLYCLTIPSHQDPVYGLRSESKSISKHDSRDRTKDRGRSVQRERSSCFIDESTDLRIYALSDSDESWGLWADLATTDCNHQSWFAGLPRNQLLNIPPATASVLATIFTGWFMKRAYTTRPAFIMVLRAGALAFFIILAATRDKYAVYIACVFGTMFYSVYSSHFGPVPILHTGQRLTHQK